MPRIRKLLRRRLTKTAEQLDLQTSHRVRERLVSQRTGIFSPIRALHPNESGTSVVSVRG
jgi:hypothetical protein